MKLAHFNSIKREIENTNHNVNKIEERKALLYLNNYCSFLLVT